MDYYRELAFESLEQQGEKGELLFCQGKTEVYRHVAKEGGAREAGNYLTVQNPQGELQADEEGVRLATLRALRWLLDQNHIGGKILVVGLGNAAALCDALGTKTLAQMRPNKNLVLFCPGTQAKTGIASGDSVSCIAKATQADAVVAVDTLACGAPRYLCRSIQLSDAGIRPGEGVGKGRKALSRDTLGMPVLYVGVPMLSFVDPFADRQCVIPQDIEIKLEECSTLLAECLLAAIPAL